MESFSVLFAREKRINGQEICGSVMMVVKTGKRTERVFPFKEASVEKAF